MFFCTVYTVVYRTRFVGEPFPRGNLLKACQALLDNSFPRFSRPEGNRCINGGRLVDDIGETSQDTASVIQ